MHMLKIRLKRLGRKKQPYYRLVVIDSKKRRDGRALKEVGSYSPLNKEIKLELMQIRSHIRNGAQMSDTVKNIVKKFEM